MTKGVDYYRVNDPVSDVDEIERTGKLRGREPRNIYRSNILKVKAYVGSLSMAHRGFEFTTHMDADTGSPPGHANWSYDPFGLTSEVRTVCIAGADFAEIDCKVESRSV